MSELFPAGPELIVRNRRIIAGRTGWPGQAVEVCERIEQESPGWWVAWSRGGDMTWKEQGFYASRIHWRRPDPGPRYVFGATADELREAIEAHPLAGQES